MERIGCWSWKCRRESLRDAGVSACLVASVYWAAAAAVCVCAYATSSVPSTSQLLWQIDCASRHRLNPRRRSPGRASPSVRISRCRFIIRLEARLQPNVEFTLRRVLAFYGLPAAIPPQWLQIAGNSLPNDPSTGCLVSVFTVVINSNSKSFLWPVHSVQETSPDFLRRPTRVAFLPVFDPFGIGL